MHIILFISVYYYNLKSESCITMVFYVGITCSWPDDGWQTGLVELPSGLVDAIHYQSQDN